MLEFRANRQKKMFVYSAVTLVCQIVLMVVLRGHYMIDLLSGLIFGHYFFMMAERISWIVDVKLLRIPFFKRFPHFNKTCSNCKKDLPHF